jgi:hypothetical protein
MLISPSNLWSEHDMPEHVVLSRGWRDLRDGFRRKVDALWFAYFEHLGLTVDYLTDPVEAAGETFQPSLWIHQWNTFVCIVPYVDVSMPPQMVSAGSQLSVSIPEFDTIVAVGTPDTDDSYVMLFSAESEPVTENRWAIAGLIDREEERAYYWMLINNDGIGYISGTRQSYAICFCGRRECSLCSRYEIFLPAQAYGTAFGIDLRRHITPEITKKRRVRAGDRVHNIEDDFRRY